MMTEYVVKTGISEREVKVNYQDRAVPELIEVLLVDDAMGKSLSLDEHKAIIKHLKWLTEEVDASWAILDIALSAFHAGWQAAKGKPVEKSGV